ncbi:hypothetical protein PpBr36_08605 [Pyricularia pennisetigena]|uniref:hypothetical protein n=1 Tax=Pyricularia pennisetigena TaxID=1578925 RepID=UPI0011534A9C|nr:hypothetical protein PpBr36_08605 [Pyricularia pennisetigena]TLS24873.1 hypothetical protein PpBr36_08605 [Pyricularia pennisetigena]
MTVPALPVLWPLALHGSQLQVLLPMINVAVPPKSQQNSRSRFPLSSVRQRIERRLLRKHPPQPMANLLGQHGDADEARAAPRALPLGQPAELADPRHGHLALDDGGVRRALAPVVAHEPSEASQTACSSAGACGAAGLGWAGSPCQKPGCGSSASCASGACLPVGVICGVLAWRVGAVGVAALAMGAPVVMERSLPTVMVVDSGAAAARRPCVRARSWSCTGVAHVLAYD